MKGWAKVRLDDPADARSPSFSTSWSAPATWSPLARFPASPWEKDDAVSTHRPALGVQPGLVEQLGAPVELGLDLAGDARLAAAPPG